MSVMWEIIFWRPANGIIMTSIYVNTYILNPEFAQFSCRSIFPSIITGCPVSIQLPSNWLVLVYDLYLLFSFELLQSYININISNVLPTNRSPICLLPRQSMFWIFKPTISSRLSAKRIITHFVVHKWCFGT